MALRDGKPTFRMPHRSQMTEDVVKQAKEQLGIAREQVQEFAKIAQDLQKLSLSMPELNYAISSVFEDEPTKSYDKLSRTSHLLLDINKNAPGQDLAGPNTAWGLLNAVTYWADHVASRTQDKRLANAWLGKTNKKKNEMLKYFMEKLK